MRTVYRVRGIVGWALWLVGITGFGMAQGVGEHVTAGFNAQRTYLNSNAGTAVFQVKNGSNALFEAGVSDSVPTGLAHVFVDRVQLAGSSFSTGIAIVNPDDEPAKVEIEFHRTSPTEQVVARSIEIGPREHVASFIEQLFGPDPDPDMEGTVIVLSDVPVVVPALRTLNGFPLSSYPVGQMPRH